MVPISIPQRLRAQAFAGKVPTMTAADRVRRRVSELITERGWSQKTVAEAFGKTQPWMSQFLSGALNIGLDELDQLAVCLGSTAVELVRDPEQFQYVADLTPSEASMLRQFRRQAPAVREALQLLVRMLQTPDTRPGTGYQGYAGQSPASPTELHHVVSAFANQISSYIAAGQEESRRQTAAARSALAVASGGHRGRRRRVPKNAAGQK